MIAILLHRHSTPHPANIRTASQSLRTPSRAWDPATRECGKSPQTRSLQMCDATASFAASMNSSIIRCASFARRARHPGHLARSRRIPSAAPANRNRSTRAARACVFRISASSCINANRSTRGAYRSRSSRDRPPAPRAPPCTSSAPRCESHRGKILGDNDRPVDRSPISADNTSRSTCGFSEQISVESSNGSIGTARSGK